MEDFEEEDFLGLDESQLNYEEDEELNDETFGDIGDIVPAKGNLEDLARMNEEFIAQHAIRKEAEEHKARASPHLQGQQKPTPTTTPSKTCFDYLGAGYTSKDNTRDLTEEDEMLSSVIQHVIDDEDELEEKILFTEQNLADVGSLHGHGMFYSIDKKDNESVNWRPNEMEAKLDSPLYFIGNQPTAKPEELLLPPTAASKLSQPEQRVPDVDHFPNQQGKALSLEELEAQLAGRLVIGHQEEHAPPAVAMPKFAMPPFQQPIDNVPFAQQPQFHPQGMLANLHQRFQQPPLQQPVQGSPARAGFHVTNIKDLDEEFDIRYQFPNSKYMRSDEIEQIVRQQLFQLHIQNPYIEDYYYYTYTAKKNPTQRRALPPNVNFILSGNKNEENTNVNTPTDATTQQFRMLGRIPAQNIRAPRTVVQFDAADGPSKLSVSSLRQDEAVAARSAIESGMNILLDIEDILLAMDQSSHAFANELRKKLDTLSTNLLDLLKIKETLDRPFILQILQYPKGIKFLTRALRLLPEPYSVIIIDQIVLNLPKVLQQIKDDDLRNQFVSELLMFVTHLSLFGLCQRMGVSIMNMNMVIPTLKTREGLAFYSTLLKKANADFPQQIAAPTSEWVMLVTKFFDSIRPVIPEIARVHTNDLLHLWDLVTTLVQQIPFDPMRRHNVMSELSMQIHSVRAM